jgi:DNA-binding FrmR family transcriptional regulator
MAGNATPIRDARLPGALGRRILPGSMTSDTHESHFRHSYTKDRRDLVLRLRRIEGQARGIQRLVEEEAYCLDVLQQVEALTAAADQVALLLLEDHIDGCLTHAIDTGQGQPYVDEVMTVVRRAMGRRAPRRARSTE